MYSLKNISGIISSIKDSTIKSSYSVTIKVYEGKDSEVIKGAAKNEWIELSYVASHKLNKLKVGDEVKVALNLADKGRWAINTIAPLNNKNYSKLRDRFLSLKIPDCSVKDLQSLYAAYGVDLFRVAKERVGLMVNNNKEFTYPLKSAVAIASHHEKIVCTLKSLDALEKAGFKDNEVKILKQHLGLNLGQTTYENPFSLLLQNKAISGPSFMYNAKTINTELVKKIEKLMVNEKMPFDEQYQYSKLYYSVDMVIRDLSSSGSTVFSKHDVVENLSKVIDAEYSEANKLIDSVIDLGVFKMINAGNAGYFVTPTQNYAIEEELVSLMVKRLKRPDVDVIPRDLVFEDYYTDEQRQSIKLALQKNILVVTGGAGTGKTTVIKGIVQNIKKFNGIDSDVVLCSPTGRAAQRISEQTMHEALTLHSVLKFNPTKGFMEPNLPVGLKALIIDEGTMVDSHMLLRVMRVLEDETKLIIVGDIKQLNAIGSGQPFKDMLLSDLLPSVTLSIPQRTGALSQIYQNANKVTNGVMPDLVDNNDYHFVQTSNDEETQKEILRIIAQDIEGKFGTTMDKVQIVSPKRQPKGFVGMTPLNNAVQGLLNKNAGENKQEILVGDRVVYKQNDYKLKLFNGDIGVIKEIKNGGILLESQGKEFLVPKNKSHLLELAYALSIYKMQGSESDVVIMPLSKNHIHMLSPESLYTAITRAKKHFVFVGDPDVITLALKNIHLNKRDTYLKTRLEQLKREYGIGLVKLEGDTLPDNVSSNTNSGIKFKDVSDNVSSNTNTVSSGIKFKDVSGDAQKEPKLSSEPKSGNDTLNNKKSPTNDEGDDFEWVFEP